jgi:hypothetical protein
MQSWKSILLSFRFDYTWQVNHLPLPDRYEQCYRFRYGLFCPHFSTGAWRMNNTLPWLPSKTAQQPLCLAGCYLF